MAESSGAFAISHDPAAAGGDPADQGVWLELLYSGLTFDLSGLANGQGTALPECRHQYSLPDLPDANQLEAITLVPGPHLAGGEFMVPILRGLAALGAEIARLEEVRAVAWHPSACWTGPDFYSKSVLRWIDGGPFPSFALTSLDLAPDGAMVSDGLAFFTGQELRIEPELASDPSGAAKLALRLIDYLSNLGKIEETQGVMAPDGTELKIGPSEDGCIARVWRG